MFSHLASDACTSITLQPLSRFAARLAHSDGGLSAILLRSFGRVYSTFPCVLLRLAWTVCFNRFVLFSLA